ncbi:MAG: FAD-binding protein [Gemmatimonadota bacterium]|nr:MAG: FAD-binding protein [Gemmatimonadota bacterium]
MGVPARVTSALAGVVGRGSVRVAPAELETYASDGLPTHHSRPGAVVLPGTREELVRVVQLLAYHRVPFVARGAGTGLSGGALADADAVLISLTRLTRILEVDPANRLAVVEPGVVNTRLTAATEPHGLHYAPDPSSQTVCTIGGNVAENAGGPHCLKYGVTTNHILELEVVLPDGSVTTLGSKHGEPWGPDLVGLFVGSEGMFGIATRITVRLTPLPKAVRTLLADFETLRIAGEAVSAIIGHGFVPAALEMIDRNCIRAVEASIYAAGYPTDAGAVLLVELDGAAEAVVVAEGAEVERLLRACGARTVQVASDASERERLWQGRKKAFGALGRVNRDLFVQDTVVPRSALPHVLEQVDRIALAHGIHIANVFHAGDGNLHPNIAFDSRDPDQLERVERASAEILEVCVAAGGTITGEHGVGADKLRYMPLIFDGDTLGAMRAVHLVFDPDEIANPGKVLPIHACRDWRRAAAGGAPAPMAAAGGGA